MERESFGVEVIRFIAWEPETAMQSLGVPDGIRLCRVVLSQRETSCRDLLSDKDSACFYCSPFDETLPRQGLCRHDMPGIVQ